MRVLIDSLKTNETTSIRQKVKLSEKEMNTYITEVVTPDGLIFAGPEIKAYTQEEAEEKASPGVKVIGKLVYKGTDNAFPLVSHLFYFDG